MHTYCFLLALMWGVSAQPSVAAADGQASQVRATAPNPAHGSVSAIQVAVHNALREEALSRRLGPNAKQVMRLIDLYREIAAHPKRDERPLLRQLALQLRSRLKQVRDRIERQIAQQGRRVKNGVRLPKAARPEGQVLAQQVAVAAGGGQGAPFTAAPSAAAAQIDYGPELVDIIQQVISPETWDINGGDGAVVYVAPRRAIVVSAPESVHEQVGDLLGQLRAAP